MNIGEAHELIQIEPTELPIPEVLPEPVVEPAADSAGALAPQPIVAPRPAPLSRAPGGTETFLAIVSGRVGARAWLTLQERICTRMDR